MRIFFRLLVNEAEDAFVLAGMDFVAQILRERNSRVLILCFMQVQRKGFFAAQNSQAQIGFRRMEAIIQNIEDRPTVDELQNIARVDARPRRRAFRFHRRNFQRVQVFYKNF